MSSCIHASFPADCEKFLSFFIGKIDSIRSHFTLTVVSPVMFSRPILLSDSAPVSLQILSKTVDNMRPSSSPCDMVPTTFLKTILPVLGPSLLSIPIPHSHQGPYLTSLTLQVYSHFLKKRLSTQTS